MNGPCDDAAASTPQSRWREKLYSLGLTRSFCQPGLRRRRVSFGGVIAIVIAFGTFGLVTIGKIAVGQNTVPAAEGQDSAQKQQSGAATVPVESKGDSRLGAEKTPSPKTSVTAESGTATSGEAGDVEEMSEEEAKAAHQSLTGIYSKSMILPRDRLVERELQKIVDAIPSQDWPGIANAFQYLTKSLTEESSKAGVPDLVELNGVVCSKEIAIGYLFESIPEDGRAVILRLIEPQVKKQLSLVMQHQDAAGLKKLVRQYRYTETGKTAREIYRRLRRDQGLFSNSKETAVTRDATAPAAANTSHSGWDLKLETPVVSQQTLDQVYHRLRQSGLNPYPTVDVILGRDLLFATLAPERKAIDPQTGSVVWSRPIAGYGAEWYRSPGNLGDSNRERLFRLTVARRVLGESIYSRTAVDHQRCYFIEPAERRLPVAAPRDEKSKRSEGPKAVEKTDISEDVEESGSGKDPVEDKTDDSSKEGGDSKKGVEETEEDSEDGSEEDGSESSSSDPFDMFPANQLVCLDQATGVVQWSTSDKLDKDIYFAGTPSLYDGSLFVLGEFRDLQAVALFEFDAVTGELLSTTNVAQAKIPIQKDLRRQDVDCQVIVDGELVVCPTAAGALFAVDRLTGDVIWAHRFPRTDTTEYPNEYREFVYRAGFELWDSWQTAQQFPIGNLLVSVSPERDELLVIHRGSGKILWRTQRDGALSLASASETHGVIVVSSSRIESFDLLTGKRRWSTVIPGPAGRGCVSGNHYLFPVLVDGFAQVDLSNGKLQTDLNAVPMFAPADGFLPYQMRPRNLVVAGTGLYEVTADGIRRVKQNGTDAAPLASNGTFSDVLKVLLSGNKDNAIQLLKARFAAAQATNESSLIQATRLALLGQLVDQFLSETTADVRASSLNDVQSLTQTVAERAMWRRLRAKDALKRKDYTLFSSLWIEGPPEEFASHVVSNDASFRCRLDRWFQHEALRIVPADQAKMNEAMAACLENLKASSGGASLNGLELTNRLGRTRWGAQLRIAVSPKPETIEDLLTWQLQLADQATSSVQEESAGAVYRLFQLYHERGNLLDADRWLTRLSQYPGDVRLPDGGTVENVCQRYLMEIENAIETSNVLSPWPTGMPTADASTRGSREIYLVPLEVENSTASGWNGITVEMDYPGQLALRFSGSAWSRPWYCSIPPTQRMLRIDAKLNRTWGLEQLLILQAGSEIYGITPFDVKGGRRAKLLWPMPPAVVDTQADREHIALAALSDSRPTRMGYHRPESRQMDEFRHYLAAVGPVLPGYLCYMQGGMLVAVDPANGAELWRRYDLPRRADCYGDADRIVVTSPEYPEVFVVSSVDGRILSRRPREHDPENVVSSDGTQATLVHGDRAIFGADEDDVVAVSEIVEPAEQPMEDKAETRRPVTVKRLELETGKVLWSRNWKTESVPIDIDQEWMGMLVDGNQLELVDQSNGQTIISHPVKVPEKTHQIFCSTGKDDFLLVFSEEIENNRFRKMSQIRGGFRRPWVKGVVYCFDRVVGEIRWTRELDEVEFPLDQPKEFPIVVVTSELDQEVKASPKRKKSAEESSTLEPTPAAPVEPPRGEPIPAPAVDRSMPGEQKGDAPSPEEKSKSSPTPASGPSDSPAKEDVKPMGEKSDKTPMEEPVETVEIEDEPFVYRRPGVVVRCFHRGTGEMIGEMKQIGDSLSSFTVTGQRSQNIVRIQTIGTRMELNYSVMVPAGAQNGTKSETAPTTPKSAP